MLYHCYVEFIQRTELKKPREDNKAMLVNRFSEQIVRD